MGLVVAKRNWGEPFELGIRGALPGPSVSTNVWVVWQGPYAPSCVCCRSGEFPVHSAFPWAPLERGLTFTTQSPHAHTAPSQVGNWSGGCAPPCLEDFFFPSSLCLLTWDWVIW